MCHGVLPEQIIAARMRATVFTSMVRPLNWLLLVHSHIKVSPALLLGSCRQFCKRNMINHRLPKDNKLAEVKTPQRRISLSSFVLVPFGTYLIVQVEGHKLESSEAAGRLLVEILILQLPQI